MEMNSNNQDKSISCQLLYLYKLLEKVKHSEDFDPFEQKSTSANNFDGFATFLEDKAKINDSINLLIQNLAMAADRGGFDSELNSLPLNQGFLERESRSLFGISKRLFFFAFEKIKLKMNEIFSIVEDYLDQAEPDLYEESLPGFIEDNLKELRTALGSQSSNSKKIRKIEEEFKKIDNIIKEELELKRINLRGSVQLEDSQKRVSNDAKMRIKKNLLSTRDKGVMVFETTTDPK